MTGKSKTQGKATQGNTARSQTSGDDHTPTGTAVSAAGRTPSEPPDEATRYPAAPTRAHTHNTQSGAPNTEIKTTGRRVRPVEGEKHPQW